MRRPGEEADGCRHFFEGRHTADRMHVEDGVAARETSAAMSVGMIVRLDDIEGDVARPEVAGDARGMSGKRPLRSGSAIDLNTRFPEHTGCLIIKGVLAGSDDPEPVRLPPMGEEGTKHRPSAIFHMR
jgi:hypothetical protein